METIISIHSIAKSYGPSFLFHNLSFSIMRGDRIGLIGPNGSGKSTLLKILTEQETPEQGFITKKQGLRIGYTHQSPDFPDLTVLEVVCGMKNPQDIEWITKAQVLLGKAECENIDQKVSVLSGGWKKRVDIIRALMEDPDILLLDEPTNHLDLEGIFWLEKFLKRERVNFMMISHDRYFLNNTCHKIIEINKCYPQGIFVSEGNMEDFQKNKTLFLQQQTEQARALKLMVKQEKEWLSRSPAARTTKSEARIQRAFDLIDTLSDIQQRQKMPKAGLEFEGSNRQTRQLLVTKNLSKKMNDKWLFKHIDITLSPGTRLGLIGKNGTGKTTLLRILAGLENHDQGTIKSAEDLKLVYFDQHREQIPDHISLKEALSPNGDFVTYQGKSIHVNGWAERFLFSSDRLSIPVKVLSGGERARILIARLMLQSADLLFLDEPTNDLDIPTLEVFEESLKEFPGAVVMISHDRSLMDKVCNCIIGLGEGLENTLFADYQQWEKEVSKQKSKLTQEETGRGTTKAKNEKKLSYQEKKELDNIEPTILKLEQEIEKLNQLISSDDKNDPSIYQKLAQKQQTLEELFHRWEELSKKESS
ncbi:MAG: ABC-F family ATP-binding cassette domain-containing protein [Rhabdochlamydiaceae bacterium]